MSTAVITGTITYPISEGGPNGSMLLGAPVVTPASTSGPSLTYNEQSVNKYSVVSGTPFVVPFGTIASADMVYIGTDQAITVKLNGGTETINVKAGGSWLMFNAGITAITISAVAVTAKVQVALFGD